MDTQIEELKLSIAQALAVIVASQADAGDPPETLSRMISAICGIERGCGAAPMLRALLRPSLDALTLQTFGQVHVQIKH